MGRVRARSPLHKSQPLPPTMCQPSHLPHHRPHWPLPICFFVVSFREDGFTISSPFFEGFSDFVGRCQQRFNAVHAHLFGEAS